MSLCSGNTLSSFSRFPLLIETIALACLAAFLPKSDNFDDSIPIRSVPWQVMTTGMSNSLAIAGKIQMCPQCMISGSNVSIALSIAFLKASIY